VSQSAKLDYLADFIFSIIDSLIIIITVHSNLVLTLIITILGKAGFYLWLRKKYYMIGKNEILKVI
jgi:hypothetical protein